MARRRYRKSFTRKVNPDRAWLIVAWSDSLIIADEGTSDAVLRSDTELFTFEDITVDEALIAREKSDWFIQRLIADVEFDFSRANDALNPGSTVLGCFHTASEAELVAPSGASARVALSTPEFLDLPRRVLNMQMRPAYPVALLPTISGGGAVATSSSAVTVLAPTAPFKGPAWMSVDVKTKASLTEGDSAWFSLGPLAQGTNTLDCADGDVYTCTGMARFLLQKRVA